MPAVEAGVASQTNLFGEEQEVPLRRRRRNPWTQRAPYRGPLFPMAEGELGKLEKSFWKFHEANPKVYTMLVKFAYQWRRRLGDQAKLGISELFERVRWEVSIHTEGNGNFKLNNNHRAFYARLIMDRHVELREMFRLRKQRIASSIGPKNEALPSGEHVRR